MIIYGCTDPLAINYDSKATLDNNSCIYSFSGIGVGSSEKLVYGEQYSLPSTIPINTVIEFLWPSQWVDSVRV
jgi:hypothetical protein